MEITCKINIIGWYSENKRYLHLRAFSEYSTMPLIKVPQSLNEMLNHHFVETDNTMAKKKKEKQ